VGFFVPCTITLFVHTFHCPQRTHNTKTYQTVKPINTPPSSFRDELKDSTTLDSVKRWTRLDTLGVMTAQCRPSNQFQRADYLADEVVRLAKLLDQVSKLIGK